MRWRFGFVAALFAMLCLSASARSDDYARIARLSFTEGHVSFQHPNAVDWTAASINLALQPGDRVYTGDDGRAEIEFDEGSVLRLAEKTDVQIVSMNESLVQIRVLVGLCTLTRQSKIPFDVSTAAASFHTLHQGVYRFDVTETGDSDGIVRKGGMQASGANFTKEVDKGELIHVEAGDNPTPVMSRYEGRDGWDEWTDRRTADAVAYASTSYVPDYVYIGVSDLDRYGQWVDIGAYGYGWVPHYVGAGWSPYWDGRWCYRPYWGWTWVSYEPWGWLPYHYGSWYFSSGFGWCWLPGPSFGFHFWSPGLVRFYNGPGWVSWAPLGPGDYYSAHNYWYAPRYGHYLNDMRSAHRRDPEDLANRHVPGAFHTAPTDQFVNGTPVRGGAGGASVVDVSQPWRSGRLVTDRLDVKPTARSYDPAIPGRTAGSVNAVPVPGAGSFTRHPAATPGSTAARVAPSASPVAGSSREVDRAAPAGVPGTRNPAETNAVNPNTYSVRGGAQNSGDRQMRIWNRVDEPAAGTGSSRTAQPGQPAAGVANPRSAGREIGGQTEAGRGAGAATRTYEAPRPTVIDRGTAGQAGAGSFPTARPEPAPRNEARPAPAAPPPSSQRPGDRRPSGFAMQQSEPVITPAVGAPERAPAYSLPAPRTDSAFGARAYPPPGRWQSPGSGTAAAPAPSWGAGRSPQAVRPSAPSGWQAPSWGRGASQPSASPGFSRSAPATGGGGAAGHVRNH